MIIEGFAKKKLNVFTIFVYILGYQGLVVLINIFNPMTQYASFVGLVLTAALGLSFYLFIQDSFLSFEYKWIDEALHLERILGKGNHVYLVIHKEEISTCESYDLSDKVNHTLWFCHRHEKVGLCLLRTTQGKKYVIKPSDELKEAILAKSTL